MSYSLSWVLQRSPLKMYHVAVSELLLWGNASEQLSSFPSLCSKIWFFQSSGLLYFLHGSPVFLYLPPVKAKPLKINELDTVSRSDLQTLIWHPIHTTHLNASLSIRFCMSHQFRYWELTQHSLVFLYWQALDLTKKLEQIFLYWTSKEDSRFASPKRTTFSFYNCRRATNQGATNIILEN